MSARGRARWPRWPWGPEAERSRGRMWPRRPEPGRLCGREREGCMAELRVGVIGTGKKKERPDALGYAMAYSHAAAYQKLPEACRLVACADIVRENAEA